MIELPSESCHPREGGDPVPNRGIMQGGDPVPYSGIMQGGDPVPYSEINF